MNQALIDTLISKIGEFVRRKDILSIAEDLGIPKSEYMKLIRSHASKCGRGTYDLAKVSCEKPVVVKKETSEEIEKKLIAKFQALKTMSKAAVSLPWRCVLSAQPPA